MISYCFNFVISDIFFPLILAICFGEIWLLKPFIQALKTFKELDEPNDLATTSLIPATSQAALIGPPAMIPVPDGAVLNKTFPAPSFAIISWWRVLPSLNGILIRLILNKV